jgi:hypothetical protein
MKNLFKLVSVLLFFVGVFAFGQEEGFSLNSQSDKLYKSESFKNFVLTDYDILFKHKADINFVKDSQKDNTIVNEKNADESAQKLGFTSLKEMESIYKNLYLTKIKFENEFNIKDFSQEDVNIAAAAVIYDYLDTNMSETTSKSPLCWRKYKRCIAIAAGTGYGVHVGCLGVDWTGIGAVICHGAAFGTAWLMMESCEDDYIECK